MNNYVKLLNNLEELGLLNIKASIDKYIDLINSGNKSIVDALYELSNLEINAKSDRAMQACVKVANFPFLKEVTDFDFDFQLFMVVQHHPLQFSLDISLLRALSSNCSFSLSLSLSYLAIISSRLCFCFWGFDKWTT